MRAGMTRRAMALKNHNMEELDKEFKSLQVTSRCAQRPNGLPGAFGMLEEKGIAHYLYAKGFYCLNSLGISCISLM